MFGNKKTENIKKQDANKILSNKISTWENSNIKEDLNKAKNKNKKQDIEKQLNKNSTSSEIADFVIETIKEKKGYLTLDNSDLIYYEDSFYKDKKITKIKMNYIIRNIIDKLEIKTTKSFSIEIFEIIVEKINDKIELKKIKSFEKVKKDIDLNRDSEYILPSNEGIIFGTFDEIIGYEDAKQEVMEDLIFWIKFPDTYKKRNAKKNVGSLFYGISGTGKSATALAFKKELAKKGFDFDYVYIQTQELASGQVSESAGKIADFFSNIRKNKKAVLLLMDEIDYLCKKRNDQAFVTERTTEFLKQLGSNYDNSNFYIIGTTNKPESIDEAMLENVRLTRKYLFNVPNLEERKKFVEKFITNNDLNIKIETNEKDLIYVIAKNTENFTGAKFNELLVNCIHLLNRKEINEQKGIITMDELFDILANISPDRKITTQIKQLKRWNTKKKAHNFNNIA